MSVERSADRAEKLPVQGADEQCEPGFAAPRLQGGTLPAERNFLRFWRWISICRISSAWAQVWTLAWAMRVTKRLWKVPKCLSILPFASGVGATR